MIGMHLLDGGPSDEDRFGEQERSIEREREGEMTVTATSTDILDEIRNGPHWKVVVRPQSFEPERIPTLDDCLSVVRDSQVRLHGWPYPYLDENFERGEDWLASFVESFEERREYWRFFQSGLFVHFFSFWEDRPSWRSETQERYRKRGLAADGFPNGFLDVESALHTITEIFEFTACLMAAGALGAQHEAPVVRIGMYQIRDRALSATLLRIVDPHHQSTSDCLEHSWRVVGPGVYDEAAKQAREATSWFLERFGMKTTDIVLKPDQEKILRRRLSL